VASVDGHERRLITADYLIGADGAHSRVREVLGIPFDGRGTFSNSITIYFRADVSAQVGGKPLSVIYINNPLFGGFFRLDKSCTSGFLVVNSVHDAADGNAAADTSEQRLVELVRAGAGIPDLNVQIDGVARWRATAQAAQSFGTDRVFLAGDSAHLMPPNGGFGGNTGIHDAHNLAWKLAACLDGIAGPNLLSTYDAERRPVCAFTAEQAYSRYVTRTAPELGTDGTQPVAHDFEIELGYVYRSLAIATESDATPMHGDPRDLAGTPGSRAPHVALVNHGASQSTIDLIGHEFCVLAGSQGAAWAEAANVLGATTPGSGLRGYQIGGDSPITDPGGDFAGRFGISEHGAVLARPDGFVAFRATGAVEDPPQTLAVALAMALGF
jgi:putative polyketide hydroxylase